MKREKTCYERVWPHLDRFKERALAASRAVHGFRERAAATLPERGRSVRGLRKLASVPSPTHPYFAGFQDHFARQRRHGCREHAVTLRRRAWAFQEPLNAAGRALPEIEAAVAGYPDLLAELAALRAAIGGFGVDDLAAEVARS